MKTDQAGRCIALVTSLLLGCSAPMEGALSEMEQGSAGGDGPGARALGPGRTPLPIVLLHGAAGFDRVGPLRYYFEVADVLSDEGYDVFTMDSSARP